MKFEKGIPYFVEFLLCHKSPAINPFFCSMRMVISASRIFPELINNQIKSLYGGVNIFIVCRDINLNIVVGVQC